MGWMSVSLGCMFKNMDLIALSPTKGRDINHTGNISLVVAKKTQLFFFSCEFCDFEFYLLFKQTSIYLLSGQCPFLQASLFKNSSLS